MFANKIQDAEKGVWEMTKFNLSEKISDGCQMHDIEVITKKDVKEFIRLLKGRVTLLNGYERLWEEIDKIAGDKLK
jgi:hypothetical protein